MLMRLEPRGEPSLLWQLAAPLLAVLSAAATALLLFQWLGAPLGATLEAYFLDPVSTRDGWSELLLKATPLALCSTGLLLCFRAGIWNIGAEGQFVVGALFGGAVVLTLPEDLGALVLAAALVAGAAAGIGWALLAAWLRTAFGANEILTTIMLNYVAVHLLAYAVHGPLMDPDGFNFPESALFPDAGLLPTLGDGRLTVAVVAAVVAVAAVFWLAERTLFGYRLRLLGAEPAAAAFAGVSVRRMTWIALAISGGLAGFAGVAEVTGPVGQLTPHVAFGYGYAAIIVAFLGRLHPLGVVPASLLMALTYLGGENLQISAGLPLSVTYLVQGLLLFYLLAFEVLATHRPRRQPVAA